MKKCVRYISIVCVIAMLFSVFAFSGNAYSNPAAAASKEVVWMNTTEILSVDRQQDSFVVQAMLQANATGDDGGDMNLDISQIRPRTVKFFISFPIEGGFRFRISEDELQSGFFNPSAVADITYLETTDTKTVMRGADNTVLTFEKTGTGFVMTVTDDKQRTNLVIPSAYIEFGFIGSSVETFRMTTPLKNGEAIYNGSERFNAVNQVGQTFSLRNEDCWSDDPVSYINVPIFHSSEGYSVWYNMTYTASADVGKTDIDKCVVDFEGGKVDFYVWTGSILENIQKYTAITGTSIVPPKWAFGYWIGAQAVPWRTNSKGSTQEDGSDAARQVAYQNMVDMFEGYEEMGITDIAAIYGEGMLSTSMPEAYEYVNNRGSRMLMWYTPQGYSTTSHLAKLLPGVSSKEYPLPLTLSSPVAGNYHGSFIDYSHPNASAAVTAFFNGGSSVTQNLKYWDLGLKGAMIDYGEWLSEEVACYNGRNGDEMHNLVSYYYAKEQAAAWDAYYPDGDYILFERSGCAGSQKYVANFTGDQKGDWEGLGDQVTGMMSMSTGGFNIVGGDMGGFGKTESEELYMRWVQLSAFSPLMRLHGQELRTPWGKGDDAYYMFPTYYWTRMNMQDMLYSAAIDANLNATPMIQPLGVAYQGQSNLYSVEDEYLFCENLLVCPVITKGATTRKVVFPEGNWYNLWTGERIAGGQTLTVSAPTDTMPVYAKSGAVMAMDLAASLKISDPMTEGTPKYEALVITPPQQFSVSSIYDTEDNITNYTSRYVSENAFSLTADKATNRQAVVLHGADAYAISVDGVALQQLSKKPDVTSTNYGFYTDNENVTYVWLPAGWTKLSVSHFDSVLPFTSSVSGLLGYGTTSSNTYPSGQAYANYSSSSFELQEEFLGYMNDHYDFYYTDYNSSAWLSSKYDHRKIKFVGQSTSILQAKVWQVNALYGNRWLQLSGGNVSEVTNDSLRKIAALVPKDNNGNVLKVKNFKAEFGIRFEKTYGSVALAFRQSEEAVFFTSSGGTYTNMTYLRVSPSKVELYDRGTTTVLHTYSGTTPGSSEAAKNFTVSLTVVGNQLQYTIVNDGGAVATVSGTATISDSAEGYMSLAMIGAYNGLRLLNVYQPEQNTNGTPMVVATQGIKNGKLEITALQSTPNADGYYPYQVKVIPNSGYQLKAGSLFAMDSKGNAQLPTNADYREFGTGDTFIVYAKNATEISAEFYQPTKQSPNFSLIGTSYHEENVGLRFVYRLNRKVIDDKPHILLNGEWVEVKDYGMLVGADYLVGNQDLSVEMTEQNSYLKKVSVLEANKYYDVSDNYVDISIQVVGLNRVNNGKHMDLAANAYVQLVDGTYLYANGYSENFVGAGGPAN